MKINFSMIRKITQMLLTPVGFNTGLDMISKYGELTEACLFNVIPGTWFLLYILGVLTGLILVSASLLIWIEMILAIVLDVDLYEAI